jgi:hypothetical protein
MKLNKNGWGFVEFFAFLIIFVVCLFIASYGLRSFGLLDEDWHFIKNQDTNKVEDNKPKVTYGSLREDMVGATMKYIKKYYNDELGIDTLNIRVSQLKSEGLLDKFQDADGNSCSGYVSVYLDDLSRIQYDAYLKCKDYETTGYEERKDD